MPKFHSIVARAFSVQTHRFCGSRFECQGQFSNCFTMASQSKSTPAPQAPPFDPLTTTATELQTFLGRGTLTTTEVVNVYLAQIEKHNNWLRAVIATASSEYLKARIEELDAERASGRVRGPLHGIPVLVKDTILTDESFGMDTTAGCYALVGAKSSYNAEIINQLTEAGAIILGKTNLSELSFWKGDNLPCGWSAVGGQSQSAYVRGGVRPDDTFAGHSNPGGSSSGSAIAVSAGFAPLAIGTETDGSIILPSNRAAIYALKPTHGLSSTKGIVPVSPRMDTVGAMAKSAEDLGNTLDMLAGGGTTKHFRAAQNKSWDNIRVGVLDPKTWKQPPTMIKPDAGASEQMLKEVQAAYQKVKPLTKSFHENIHLIPVTEFMVGGSSRLVQAQLYDFGTAFNKFLSTLEKSNVHNLSEVIAYNEEHASKELPEGYSSQAMLIKSLNPGISKDEDEQNWLALREAGRARGLDATLQKYDIDVILAPADSPATKFPSAAGYPDMTLPLSYLDFNGRPFGIVALVSGGQEDILLRVAGAWQATFPSRVPPPLLAEETEGRYNPLL